RCLCNGRAALGSNGGTHEKPRPTLASRPRRSRRAYGLSPSHAFVQARQTTANGTPDERTPSAADDAADACACAGRSADDERALTPGPMRVAPEGPLILLIRRA